MKKALLARPSSLIVQNMRKFMITLGLEPIKLSTAQELANFDIEEVGCIVISTALSSTVKESYCELILRAKDTFPSKPILVASFADIKRSKIIVNAKFKEANCGLELVSLEEATSSDSLNFENHCVLITNREISGEPSFSTSVHRARNFLVASTAL